MKKIILIISLAAVILSCSDSIDPNYTQDYNTINGLDLKAAIALANDWHYSQPKVTSYITPKELIISFPDGRQIKKTLPDSAMFIAVAPYITNTHTCDTHYLSSCQGELTNKVFQLKASDTNGNILYNDSISSMKNGFFELWLPRDRTITIHIVYNTMTRDELIGTFSTSNTCITTAQLK
ncbi:MAG: CueP family metal-binding protein [FCB group bacterium]|jgi:hypothetical protein